MRRQWDGDSYAALRDCYATLIRDPNHVKALFRLTRCLHQLKLFKEAKACIAVFQVRSRGGNCHRSVTLTIIPNVTHFWQ
jgi:WD and tetratricopeptide repeat-containing protein 1